MSNEDSETLFCPEIGGPCIKENCAAYSDSLTINLLNGKSFVKKSLNEDIDYDLPMSFLIQVGGCTLYDKIIDKKERNLMKEFEKDIG